MATRRSAEIFILPFRDVLWPSGSSQIFIISRNIFVLLLKLMAAGGLSVIFPCGNYCSNNCGNGTFGVTALFELSHSHTISYRNKNIVPFPLP